jgi:hypothetical protein
MMFAALKDWHLNLSWKLGCCHGQAGRKASPPWWADKAIYALGVLQGKGVIK